jgi:hypothetical protein
LDCGFLGGLEGGHGGFLEVVAVCEVQNETATL